MKTFLSLMVLIFVALAEDVKLTVLGSGGPELDTRASSGYVLQIDGKARLLVDAGSGVMLRFGQNGFHIEDLDALALTHLHIDHTADLASFVKAGYFSARRAPLSVIGPEGNRAFPSIETFLEGLFGENGIYRYMHDVLTPKSDSFELLPRIAKKAMHFKHFTLYALPVHHGIVPALAYRIETDGKAVVVSGDTNDADGTLAAFAKNADILIMHLAILETGYEGARALHMIPSQIGRIAAKSKAKKLVLSHRMRRTYGREQEILRQIKAAYRGPVIFAEDNMTFSAIR